MKQILRLATVLIGLMLCSSAFAQTRTVSGTVKDENGKPLPFLAVQVKGTTIGTYTDTAGKFSLTVDQTAKTLVLNYPGMKNQETPITDNMQVTMKSDALGLDEVVVTAIGVTQEKKALGYATQTVGDDQLNTTGTSNVMNELDGKVAGLQVINSSGDPGAGTYIDLRGPTSITGNNQPLIVIDGIPVDNSINNFDPSFAGFNAGGASGQLNGGAQPTNRGLDINPSDVESVTVLKGPAATALYGIAAANGALIITTKKGHKNEDGAVGVEVNSSLTWSQVNKLPAIQNTYAQGAWGDPNGLDATTATYYGPNSGVRTSWGPLISSLSYYGPATPYSSMGTLYPTGTTGVGTLNGPAKAYNPYDFFQTGVANDNNVAFTGGNDRSSFRVSLGNLYQTGIIPNTNYNKTTLGINGQTALGKRLKASASVNYINSLNNKAQQGNNTSGVMFLLRTPPTFDNSNGNGANAANLPSTYMLPDGSPRSFAASFDNPYWTVNENTVASNLNRVFGNMQLDYDINEWMKLTYRIGGDAYIQDDKSYYNPQSATLGYEGGGVFIADYINTILNSDLMLNINKKLSDNFDLNVLLGQNYYDNVTDTRLAEGTGLTLPNFPDLANATSFNGTTEGEVDYRRSALYGQAVLGYAHQVYLTISGRDETSSSLPADHDNFFYPSVDLGWVFTETFKMSTNKILPYGKLRLSYANVGQDAPPQSLTTPYRTAGVADGYSTGVSFPFSGLPGYMLSTSTAVMGNPNLLPQSTAATEVGLDLTFLSGKITFSGTYYSSKTTNEILTVPIPLSTGFAAEELNAGIITNNGVELSLNTTPVKTKNFRWDLGINWSKNVNKVVQLAPGVNSLLLDALGNLYDVPGYSASYIYGTDFVRVGTYDPANPNKGIVLNDQGTPATNPGYGQPFLSPNAPGPLAPTQPDWIGGLTTSVTYKNFTLGAVMSIREGGYMIDGTQGAMEYYGTAGNTSNRGSAYTPPSGAVWGHLGGSNGTTVIVDNASQSESGVTNSEYYYQNLAGIYGGETTGSIYPSGYVRISQINLTYDLPMSLVKKAHFTKVAITLFANNPVLWTKYPGVDPETSFAGPSNAQGEDWFNNPNTWSYGFRLNLDL